MWTSCSFQDPGKVLKVKKNINKEKTNGNCVLELKAFNSKCVYMLLFHSDLQLNTRQAFEPAYQKVLTVTEQTKLNP